MPGEPTDIDDGRPALQRPQGAGKTGNFGHQTPNDAKWGEFSNPMMENSESLPDKTILSLLLVSGITLILGLVIAKRYRY